MRAAFPEQFDFVPSALSFRETKCPGNCTGDGMTLWENGGSIHTLADAHTVPVPDASFSMRLTRPTEVDEGRQLKLALFKDVPRMTWASGSYYSRSRSSLRRRHLAALNRPFAAERVEASVLWLPDLRHGISSVMQVLYHVSSLAGVRRLAAAAWRVRFKG